MRKGIFLYITGRQMFSTGEERYCKFLELKLELIRTLRLTDLGSMTSKTGNKPNRYSECLLLICSMSTHYFRPQSHKSRDQSATPQQPLEKCIYPSWLPSGCCTKNLAISLVASSLPKLTTVCMQDTDSSMAICQRPKQSQAGFYYNTK